MTTSEFLLSIIVCIGVYLIYRQRQIYLLKKYVPGTGEIITTIEVWGYKDPTDAKYFRILRQWKEEVSYSKPGNRGYNYYQECEIWE